MTKRTVRKKMASSESHPDREFLLIAFVFLILAIWAAILFASYLRDRWESQTDPQGLPALIWGKKDRK